MKRQQTAYVIVSYERAGEYEYWTGRHWTADRRQARRYAVRSARFSKAIGDALASWYRGSVGLLRQGD